MNEFPFRPHILGIRLVFLGGNMARMRSFPRPIPYTRSPDFEVLMRISALVLTLFKEEEETQRGRVAGERGRTQH